MNRLYIIITSLLLLFFVSVHGIYAYDSSVTVNADTEVAVKKVVRVNENETDIIRKAEVGPNRGYPHARKSFIIKQESSAVSTTEFSVELDAVAEANEEAAITETVGESEFAGDARLKPLGSTTVSAGQGWAIHGNEGVFVRLVFAEKQFLNIQTNEEIVRSRGLIKLGGMPMHRLVLTSETNNSMTFNVTGRGKDKVVGTLELSAQTTLSGFSVWNGKLILNSTSYDLMVATQHKILRDKSLRETDSDKNEGNKSEGNAARSRIGFWARFKSFFRR